MKKYIIPTIEQIDFQGGMVLSGTSNPPQGNDPEGEGGANAAPTRKVF